ncbi:disulfide bond formation protein B [Pleionea litopenaei]|uniref:Disulfide bond formation protein B n=1 Tax=Pleionea litopenaei TaxID=3070815 RepID=A0AA51X5K8_9GAMM|nr:disulfide bond formation protein B [Pleionea sp. HL-JVS1]WMS86227.1 disulfide bond formation protein B [Pleionea sp. HL-JVS1]
MSVFQVCQKTINQRWFSFFVAGVCAALMGAALYFQYGLNLEPCPLCIFQRIVVIVFGAVFLLKALFHPRPESGFQYFFFFLALLVAGLGVGIAGRHVWLQNLPEHLVPACGPALDYLMDVLPFMEMLETVFKGSGECAKQDGWSFLALNMPEWMVIIFSVMLLFSLFGLWTRWQNRKPF